MPIGDQSISAFPISAVISPLTSSPPFGEDSFDPGCDCCISKACDLCNTEGDQSMSNRTPYIWTVLTVAGFSENVLPVSCSEFNGNFFLQQPPNCTTSCYWAWGRQTVSPPYNLAASLSAGGSLPVGTWYYQITAKGPLQMGDPGFDSTDNTTLGETTPSNETSVQTNPGNQTASLTWTAPPADIFGGSKARRYNVYRGTSSGGENVLVAQNVNATSYNDTGTSVGPGSPPTTNSSGAAARVRIELFEDSNNSFNWTVLFTDMYGPPVGTDITCQAYFVQPGGPGSLNVDSPQAFQFDHLTAPCVTCVSNPPDVVLSPSSYCGCCFNTSMAATLNITITSADDPACACLVGLTWQATWNPANGRWETPSQAECGGGGAQFLDFYFECLGGGRGTSSWRMGAGSILPHCTTDFQAPITTWSVGGAGTCGFVELTFSGGVLVSGVVANGGSGYVHSGNVPITVTSSVGTGASVHATTDSTGHLNGVVVVSGGSGYPDQSCNPLTLPFRFAQNGGCCGSMASHFIAVLTS